MKKIIFLLFCVFSWCSAENWLSDFKFLKNRQAVKAYQAQDYEDALEKFHTLMNKDPYNPEYNYNVGDIFYKQKKYQDAQHAFFRAAEKADAASLLQEQALFNAGNSSYQLEEWLQAVQAYQHVLKINEDNESARHNLQLALYKLQEQKMNEDQQEKQQDQKKSDKQDKQQNQSSDKNQSENTDCGCKSQDEQDSGDDQGQSDEGNSQQQNSGQKQKGSQKNGKSDENQQGHVGDDQDEQGQDEDDGYDQKENGSDEGQQLDAQQKGQQQKENQSGMDQAHGQQDDVDTDELAEKLSKQSQQKGDEDKGVDQFGQEKNQVGQEQEFAGKEDKSDQTSDKKGTMGGYKKPELKDQLKHEYESKASDDERLNDYHASVMKTLEDLEEKIQKHVIKNKVAMQGADQHEKKGW